MSGTMDWREEDWLSAQTSVLGSVLLDAQRWAGEVVSRTAPEDYSPTYRPIYEVIRRKFQAGETIDPVTVRHELEGEAGPMLMEIMAVTPTAANCGEYIDLMLERSRLSKLRGLAQQLLAAPTLTEAQALLDQANALSCRREKVRVVTMDDALKDFFARQEQTPEFLAWGIRQLDERLDVEAGDFVILGGYPSAGKTALAISMAWSQATEHRVGFFSCETSDAKLFDRLVSSQTQVELRRIKRRKLKDNHWDAVAQKVPDIRRHQLELIQAAGMTVTDIQAVARSRRHEVIYIDYLQLIRPDGQHQSAYEQTTQISKSLHLMAQRTGITVIALSQLSRPEKTGKRSAQKAPGMSDLRDSGQIEQDGDVIMLIYREEQNLPNSRRALKVAKNKEGESGGIIMLKFDGATQTFRPDRNDPGEWRAKQESDQISLRELGRGTPVPFEEDRST